MVHSQVSSKAVICDAELRAVLLGEQHVVIGAAVEGRVEVDQVHRLIFDVVAQDFEVVAVVELILLHGCGTTLPAMADESSGLWKAVRGAGRFVPHIRQRRADVGHRFVGQSRWESKDGGKKKTESTAPHLPTTANMGHPRFTRTARGTSAESTHVRLRRGCEASAEELEIALQVCAS